MWDNWRLLFMGFTVGSVGRELTFSVGGPPNVGLVLNIQFLQEDIAQFAAWGYICVLQGFRQEAGGLCHRDFYPLRK